MVYERLQRWKVTAMLIVYVAAALEGVVMLMLYERLQHY